MAAPARRPRLNSPTEPFDSSDVEGGLAPTLSARPPRPSRPGLPRNPGRSPRSSPRRRAARAEQEGDATCGSRARDDVTSLLVRIAWASFSKVLREGGLNGVAIGVLEGRPPSVVEPDRVTKGLAGRGAARPAGLLAGGTGGESRSFPVPLPTAYPPTAPAHANSRGPTTGRRACFAIPRLLIPDGLRLPPPRASRVLSRGLVPRLLVVGPRHRGKRSQTRRTAATPLPALMTCPRGTERCLNRSSAARATCRDSMASGPSPFLRFSPTTWASAGRPADCSGSASSSP